VGPIEKSRDRPHRTYSKYDFMLEHRTGLSSPSAESDPGGVDLYGAVQGQLGLKFATEKGEVEMLVIDHVGVHRAGSESDEQSAGRRPLRHVILPPVRGPLSTRNASLRLLIQTAYSVQTFQIVGGREWMSSAGYDVDAKAAGTARSTLWRMLKALLEDRCQPKVHRETREMPAYTLTAAKGGLKLPEPRSDCIGKNEIPPPPARCGDLLVTAENGDLSLQGSRLDVAELSSVLSGMLQRPVLDGPGAKERFDLQSRFAHDGLTVGIGKPRDPATASAESIVTALQHQSRLRVESTKAPGEVPVIDQAARPAELTP
jgi:uncharacterized protein (TIGR03435 family)